MSLPDHLLEQLLSICKTPQNRDMLVEAIETGGGDLDAVEIAYDNTDSGLTATDLQSAVDELAQGSGGSGADTDLSNLTSPTAINQDLSFGSGTTGQVVTKNETFNTQAMNVKSGDSGNNSGAVTISSGQATNNSGVVYLNSGDTVDSVSGDVVINTGFSENSSRGKIRLETDTTVGGSFTPTSPAGTDIGSESLPFSALEALAVNLRQSGNYFVINLDGSLASLQSSANHFTFKDALLSDILDPVSDQDAATKNYVDTVVTGASGTFTTVDSKTVTVVNGLITSIV